MRAGCPSKLVLALYKTKRLFRLFRFYTETEIFDVSIEPKQTEDQPKQFDREVANVARGGQGTSIHRLHWS
jgi:hypothetical protein